MARSVSVPSTAVLVAYTTFEGDGGSTYDEFQELIDELREALRRTFPSVVFDDRWIGREDHIIAGNNFACFGLSEYMGLVSVWAVPVDSEVPKLRDYWINKIEPNFHQVVRMVFGDELRKIGTFSNGEAVFQQVH